MEKICSAFIFVFRAEQGLREADCMGISFQSVSIFQPVKGGGASTTKPKSRKGTGTSRSRSRSTSPKKQQKKQQKKSANKKRSKLATDKPEKKPVDMLDPAAMTNLYYIAHGPVEALEFRGFHWPDAPKKKKGGKGKKKKK